MRSVDERAAEQVIPFRWGHALINRRLNLVRDVTFLIADRLQGADAAELAAEADRIQGEAGILHRRVNVDNRAAAGQLSTGFTALGYQPERFVIMVHQRAPDRQVDTSAVREVQWAQLRPARELERRQQTWSKEPGLVEQIVGKQELTASRVHTRYFGVVLDGQVASSCELRTEGDVAQIETVETLEVFRRRGLSRAVVSAALEAASAYEFVFLVADAADWPQELYR